MTHSFTLILVGPDPNEPANLDRLFEAGCADAIIGSRDGVNYASFNRTAVTFSAALSSAIKDIEAAVPGLRVIGIERELG
jgi:hypothetical protein